MKEFYSTIRIIYNFWWSETRVITTKIQVVNTISRGQFELSWWFGQKIIESQEKHGWGKSVVEQLYQVLRRAFPNTPMVFLLEIYGKWGHWFSCTLILNSIFYIFYHYCKDKDRFVPRAPKSSNLTKKKKACIRHDSVISNYMLVPSEVFNVRSLIGGSAKWPSFFLNFR